MFFLIDSNKKIIFGWSAKCGCSHVKNIFKFLQNNKIDNQIHCHTDCNKLPSDIENYTTLIFVRNPYKRITSGFLDKYQMCGQFRHLWTYPNLSFTKFVDELVKHNWNMIDHHHFTPQTSEHFDTRVCNSKIFKVYDIEKIDYKYIENLYNTKIPENVINKQYGHERYRFIQEEKVFNTCVSNLSIDEYVKCTVDIKYLYNEKIKKKIFEFFKNDFTFFKENGIDFINYNFE
jgi:hypothetical protein